MSVKHPLQIGDVARADFRTSLQSDSENSRIQKACVFMFRYQPARLAIALSLSDVSPPAPSELGGKPIKGDTLFGQDEADITYWIALLVQHSSIPEISRREFQECVAAHWARGIALINNIVQDDNVQIETLIAQLMQSSFSEGKRI